MAKPERTWSEESALAISIAVLSLGFLVLPFLVAGDRVFETDPLLAGKSSVARLAGYGHSTIGRAPMMFQVAYAFAAQFWPRVATMLVLLVAQLAVRWRGKSPITEYFIWHLSIWSGLAAMLVSLGGIFSVVATL
jgi:hypothetical protein